MSDKFKKLTPGERYRTNAELHNLLVEIAREREAKRSLSSQGIGTGTTDPLLVLNLSGSVITKFGVVGLAAPVTPPAVDLPEFMDGKGFESAGPDPVKPFAIVQEPISADTIGEALALGLTQCRIDMAAAGDGFAVPIGGDYGKLASSSAAASAQILWRDTVPAAAREELAVLRTGVLPPGGGDGADGDYWADTVAGLWYGPKAAGAWPAGAAFGTGVVWAVVMLGPNVAKCGCGCEAIGAAGTAEFSGGSEFTGPGATAYDTWVCPAGVTKAFVECWGPGGLGDLGESGSARGGGGGAYAAAVINVVPGRTYHILRSGDDGSLISDSTLLPPTQVMAAAGNPGAGVSASNSASFSAGEGGLAASCIGTVKISGGKGGEGSPGGQASGGGGGGGADANGPGVDGEDGTFAKVVAQTPAAGGATQSAGGNGEIFDDILDPDFLINATAGAQPGGGGGGMWLSTDVSGIGGLGKVRIRFWGDCQTVINGVGGSIALGGENGATVETNSAGNALVVNGPLVNGVLPTSEGGLGLNASTFGAGSIPQADGAGAFIEHVNNFAGGGAPTVTDDSGSGYVIGSTWIG